MKSLKYIRSAIGLLLVIVATAYLLRGQHIGSHLVWVEQMQILPTQKIYLSAIAILTAWLMITLAFGRIYCACICPVGILQDIVRSIVRMLPQKWGMSKPGRYKSPRRFRYIMVIIYVVGLCAGSMAAIVPFILSPWPAFANIVNLVADSPEGQSAVWAGISTLTGIICGAISLVVIAAMSALCGRDLCNTICPIGIGLGMPLKVFGGRALVNIDIDPDRCIHCMKCEEACPAHCIDVKSNMVDNERCIRCMDCLPPCPNDAIHYTTRRPRLSNTQTI